MSRLLGGIACRRMILPPMILEDVMVLFADRKIEQMGSFASNAMPPDVYDARSEQDLIVIPGFVDVHVHGYGGCDFLDATEESFRTISAIAARGGCTSMLATTTFSSEPDGLEKFAEIVRLLKTVDAPGARFIGMHMEGPYINPSRRGSFRPPYLQPFNRKTAQKVLEICGDVLVKVTLAPELDGADELMDMLTDLPNARVEIAPGHSTATNDQAMKLFDERPNTHTITHIFNALNSLHHREAGMLGAALVDDRVSVELISDGFHVCPTVMKMIYKLKGPKKTIVITDATPAAQTEPGTKWKSLGGLTEVKDGAVRMPDGTLAGSNLIMQTAFQGMMQHTGASFEDCVEMCTLTPARSIHLEDRIGSIDIGKMADFTILKPDGTVVATIRDGLLVYEANPAAMATA